MSFILSASSGFDFETDAMVDLFPSSQVRLWMSSIWPALLRNGLLLRFTPGCYEP